MAKTTVLIDIAVGPQLPPDTAWLQWAAPIEFDSGNTYVLAVPAAVKLIDGKGEVSVDPGIWIVTSVGLGTITTRAWEVPASDTPVQFNTLLEVTDLSNLGFGPTWAARAEKAALDTLATAARLEELFSELEQQLGSDNEAVAAYFTSEGPTRSAAMELINSLIDAGVPDAAAAYLASQPAVADAAALAAAAAISGLQVVVYEQLEAGSPWAWTMAYDGNREVWLGKYKTGRYYPDWLNAPDASSSVVLEVLPRDTGWLMAAYFAGNREVQWGVRIDGTTYPSSGGGAVSTVPKFYWVGDSLTAGISNINYLRALIGNPQIDLYGIGGQQSVNAAARQGGSPALATVAGGVIPASGSVAVTTDTNLRSDTGTTTVELFGVIGEYAASAAGSLSGTFTRTTAGASVPLALDEVGVPYPVPMITNREHRDFIPIIWVGRNNFKQTDARDWGITIPSGSGIAGTFKLAVTVGGIRQVTAALNWNATAAEIQAALVALTVVGAGGATVAVSSGGSSWNITFSQLIRSLDPGMRILSSVTGATTAIQLTRGRTDFPERIVANVRAMLAWSNRGADGIVLSIPPWEGEEYGAFRAGTLDAANNALAAAFPTRYVDTAAMLRSDDALLSVGITPDANNRADIAAGLTPRDLRLPGDAGHLNAKGYEALFIQLARVIKSKGLAIA